jgi:hypothetical protein
MVLDLRHGAGKEIDVLKKANDKGQTTRGFPVACTQHF